MGGGGGGGGGGGVVAPFSFLRPPVGGGGGGKCMVQLDFHDNAAVGKTNHNTPAQAADVVIGSTKVHQ